MSSGIAVMSIVCIMVSAAIAAADGTAIGAVRKPRIARIESRRAIRDQSLMPQDMAYCVSLEKIASFTFTAKGNPLKHLRPT
ncbi:hypothetical protein AMC81_PE00838 (plasmid) [Rhizobium phaseoli]|uniref:Secreted protein n=1 Tax=Rhizobium phaseoli TaxID=396 RepID=A0ABN4QYT6_9HYPH|nr:hypothetical protein AMC81_PE00838 [Rhizobium phaseoli]ANL95590.1 hypothetical protein AMC80_PE00838 [Rhizobium phaseoli]